MALGATKKDVLLQMMRRGMTIIWQPVSSRDCEAAYFVSSALGTRLIQVDPKIRWYSCS